MRAEPALVRSFELLAAAHGGVGRLRDFVLSLALRGKLVAEEGSEESAAASLIAARAENERQMAGGQRKREHQSQPVAVDEQPFALPHGWVWCRVTDTGEYINGLAFKPTDWGTAGRPIIRIQNLSGRSREFNRTSKEVDPSVVVRTGDILVSWSATLDAFIWQGEEGVLNQHIFRVTPSSLVDKGYLFWLLKGVIKELAASDHAHGLVMRHINRGPFLAHVVAIPPLPEQRRIVSRVEKLMKLCDALEQSGRLADAQHARLTATLFDALAASESAHALAENWGRIAEHFDLLLDLPEAIDALEQTIRQLAVDGLLVSGDERRGKFEEMTLGAVVSFLNGYAFKSEWFRSDGVRLVRNVNIAHGELTWGNVARVDDAVALDLRRFALRADDLVISLDRPIISTGLKYAVVRECDLSCLLLQRVAKMVPREGVLASAYLELWLRSPAFIGAIDPGRSNGVPHISTRQLEAISFSLPPFSEQNRVVAYAEKLLRHCAQLRERLRDARQAQSRLADALVAEVAT